MMSRPSMLSLLAVLALGLGQGSVLRAAEKGAQKDGTDVAVAITSGKKGSSKARFGLLNAISGNTRINGYLDGKQVAKNQKPGKGAKLKSVNAEGYDVYVGDSKLGIGFLNLTYTMIAGRDYLLVPMLNSYSGWYEGIMVDIPSLVVPKTSSHIVFVSALYDGVPLDVLVNGQLVQADLQHMAFTQPSALIASKISVEFQIDGARVAGPFNLKLKGGQTTTLVLSGTLDPADKVPVQLVSSVAKSQ